jgi:hypothetical protein
MKTTHTRRHPRGYASVTLVLSTGMLMTLMMMFAYQRAINGQSVQADVQLQVDYAEKEETILRSIVAITPNRAMRAMQHNSNSHVRLSEPLRFQNIFSESLVLANARTSIPSQVLATMDPGSVLTGNSGDSALGTPSRIFKAIPTETGWVSRGINRSLGTGFPPPLTSGDSTTTTRDATFPIISRHKVYGTHASGLVGLPVAGYPNFNLIPYPRIAFGYARPGEPFVAKRNWWAFGMDLADHDTDKTKIARFRRQFVLSIYEIPSQLPISASSFLALGEHSSGESWANVSIDGGVFAGRAAVEGATELPALASRRGMQLSQNASIGGQSFTESPFRPGKRDDFLLTQGDFFPVSMASESGRAAFIPINRGADYFDRFAHAAESNTVSTQTWNDYSVGALQTAMRLDITQATSADNRTPTRLRFQYMRAGSRQTLDIPLNQGVVSGLPQGYIRCCNEHETYFFPSVVDVAYGANGQFYYQNGVSGHVTFNNARFGDPIVGTFKAGYFRAAYPFEIRALPGGQICVAVYPKRFAAFLALLGADNTSVNHSLTVNVDYTASALLARPNIPCTDNDYGCILEECDNLNSFPRGFSLVTNLRLYIGDDFNTVPGTPPSGYTPPGPYYPPTSLFAPEKRIGVNVDPRFVEMSGQVGSLAHEDAAQPVRPLDMVSMSGNPYAADRITVNLRAIRHPAELPPINMMNWLVVIEERRREFY